ncbi:MAG: polysaccharide biosynthesis/export family protein [Alsobacter sp.]
MAPAHAEYILKPGDTLELSFVGIQEQRQRSTIGVDGFVAVPLVGPVTAAGQSLTAFREGLKSKINNRIYRQIGSDGRENTVVLSADDLYVNLVAYRPVYVNGDVTRAGEQEFRPGMTVRHAISVAGGFDVTRFRIGSPMEPIDFKRDYLTALTDYIRESARNVRINAALNGKEPDFSGITSDDLSPDDLKRILDAEAMQFKVRNADLMKDKAFLADAIAKSENRISVTTQQRDREMDQEKEDVADLDRVKELVQKGSAPITRVTDARRMSLFSATRVLQTTAQINALSRETEELRRRLQRADDDFRIAMLRELQESNVALSTAKARIDAQRQKLSLASSPRGIPSEEVRPRIVIYRTVDGKEKRLDAGMDTGIEPGDVVEVTVPATKLFGLTTVQSN